MEYDIAPSFRRKVRRHRAMMKWYISKDEEASETSYLEEMSQEEK